AILFLSTIRSSTRPRTHPVPPLKPFVPSLLPLLTDSDPTVRQTSFAAVVELFTDESVSRAARADLKKGLERTRVPQKTIDAILDRVLGGGGGAGATKGEGTTSVEDVTTSLSRVNVSSGSGSGSGAMVDESDAAANSVAPPPRHPPRSRTAVASPTPSTTTPASGSIGDSLAPRPKSSSSKPFNPTLPATAFPSDPSSVHSTPSQIQAVYLASVSDLWNEVESFKPSFEGKETEKNWIERDRAVTKLRGMVVGGAAGEAWRDEFVRAIKEVQDGIVKTLLDPFLPQFLSMASQTKKIVATASQETVEALIRHGSFHVKTVHLLAGLLESEKTTSARAFVSRHLATFVSVHSTTNVARQRFDSTGATDLVVEAIRRGLSDPNADVRLNSREAYWAFVGAGSDAWSDRAENEVRQGLDGQARKLLDAAGPVKRREDGAGDKNGGANVRPAPRRSVGVARREVSSTTTTTTASNSRGTTPSATRDRVQGQGDAPPSEASGTKKPTMRELMIAAKRKALAERKEQERRDQANLADADADGSNWSSLDHVDDQTGGPRPEEPRLQDTVSPFASNRPRRDSSPDHPLEGEPVSGPSSPSPSHPRPVSSQPSNPSARLPELPVVDPIVDDALESRALQAQQTVERLIEIGEEERDHANGTSVAPAAASSVVGDEPRSTDTTTLSEVQTPVSSSASPRASNLVVRTGDLDDLAEAFRVPSAIDLSTIKRLSTVSRDFVVRVEVGDGLDGSDLDPVAATSESFKAWKDARRFDSIWNGLKRYLVDPTTVSFTRPVEDVRDQAHLTEVDRPSTQNGLGREMALGALRDLVENQSPCLIGHEADVFELLFELRRDSSRTTSASTESIATLFASRLEPLYGLGTLSPALSRYVAPASSSSSSSTRPELSAETATADASVLALALKLVGTFFEALPAEVLEDVVPQFKELVQKALNHTGSGELRRAAINSLVSAQVILNDEKRLVEMVGGLTPEQANLLAYYCAKRGA
ncbi:hypothetical protein JCM10212_006848, partial [Sporobolomyces blumeae]